MEKDQVTFAVTASGLTGPVGRPILLICEALASAPQSFVVLRAVRGEMRQQHRYEVAEGAMHYQAIDEISSVVHAELYTAFAYYKGIQAEFEALP